jgi:hypothetical protein
LEPAGDVADGVLEIHGLQMAMNGDPLPELEQILPAQNLQEFGGAGEDNLNQLLRLGLKVGDEADLFKNRWLQVLDLVNAQDDDSPLRILTDKERAERLHEGEDIGTLSRNPKGLVDVLKKIGGGKAGVEDQGRAVLIRVELAEESAQNRGLPRSILSGQGNEPGTILDTVKKMGESLPMALAQEEKAGVRSRTEGGFPEAVKVKVHWK